MYNKTKIFKSKVFSGLFIGIFWAPFFIYMMKTMIFLFNNPQHFLSAEFNFSNFAQQVIPYMLIFFVGILISLDFAKSEQRKTIIKNLFLGMCNIAGFLIVLFTIKLFLHSEGAIEIGKFLVLPGSFIIPFISEGVFSVFFKAPKYL